MRLLASPWRRLVAIVIVFLACFVLWFALAANPLGSPGRVVLVQVTPGESVSQWGSDLQHQGVISSSFAFRIDTLVFGTPTLHEGTFAVRQRSSFSTVRKVFDGPPTAALTVVPGLTLREVQSNLANVTNSNAYATRFGAAAARAAATSPFDPNGSLEGLIGLGTYVILPGESPTQLVDAMTSRFLVQARSVGIVPGATIHGLSAYQTIIAASIVEKEGYYHENMPKVARVILNRLARGGGLQMDSTILYYFHEDGGTVTSAMLATPTPYNTYLHAGLTPTPICQPSLYALHSMVNPPKGSWLYFTLIDKNGTMAFSTTFAEQLRNEEKAAAKGIG